MIDKLQRFLALVEREIAAKNVYLRVGGAPLESGPTVLCTPWKDRCIVVAEWAEPLDDLARERAARMVAELVGTAFPDDALVALPAVSPARVVHDVSRELDETLGLLARRARADEALVIDHRSPEIWGSSEYPRDQWNVEDALAVDKIAHALAQSQLSLVTLVDIQQEDELQNALRDAGLESTTLRERARDIRWVRALCDEPLDASKLRIFQAIAAARNAELPGHDALPPNVRVRAFANIYRVVLVFDDAVSELHVETALHKMLPLVERLVLALPPRDPNSAGRTAKVQPIRRLRPV